MLCKDCVNTTYCGPFQKSDNMRGCGRGIPELHPSAVAEKVVRKVNLAVDELGLDRDEYSREVVAEITKALNQRG